MHIVVAIAHRFAGQPSLALRRAIDLARPEDDRIVAVLHRPPTSGTDDALDDEIDALTEFLEPTDRGFKILPLATRDEMAPVLCQVAREQDASVIVVDVARQQPHGKSMLGEQAQRLILESPCDVLIARSPDGWFGEAGA